MRKDRPVISPLTYRRISCANRAAACDGARTVEAPSCNERSLRGSEFSMIRMGMFERQRTNYWLVPLTPLSPARFATFYHLNRLRQSMIPDDVKDWSWGKA